MRVDLNWINEEFVDLSHISPKNYAEAMEKLGHQVRFLPDANTNTGSMICEIQVPDNRADCHSITGLARESAAAFGLSMNRREPHVEETEAGSIYDYLDVDVSAEWQCNRYTARMVVNLRPGPSPAWMQQRLLACGIQPENNITDIANYVTLEYGQPVCAFDYSSIPNQMLMIREAEEGEIITSADGTVHTLEAGMLVTSDYFAPLGLAGIMTGPEAQITPDTTMVVFEAANYRGEFIRTTAAALGIHNRHTSLFSLNPDPMLTLPAVQRACELVQQLSAGDVLDGIIDVLNYVPEPRELPLDTEMINSMLGTCMQEEEITEYLETLEIPVADHMIQLPSFRPDLNDIQDIAREIQRIRK